MTLLADTLAPDSPAAWVNAGGLLGLLLFLLLAFLRGWLVSGPSHDREIAAKDREIAELKAEQQETRLFVRDQMTPLLTRTQDVLAKTLEERAWSERQRRETKS